jgi:hypothetical protein
MDKRNKAPKKTKIGFGVLGLVILAIVTFGGIVLSKSITTKRYDGDIVSFSFHSGSYFGGYGEYEIKNEGGELKFSARGYNGKDVNVDKTISGEYLDRIDAVLIHERHVKAINKAIREHNTIMSDAPRLKNRCSWLPQ